jgi:hypothetical protein
MFQTKVEEKNLLLNMYQYASQISLKSEFSV